MELSICIVSWNTRDLLASCLSSIELHLGDVEHETIVVDNASRDGSRSMLRERFPRVRLISNRDNLGFARATNQALRQSKGRYLLLLNSDTLLIDASPKWLLTFMDQHPEAGAAGARLLNPDLSIQPYPTRLPSLVGHLAQALGLQGWIFRLSSSAAHRSRAPKEVGRVKGACMIVRREVLCEVGLLDEDLFLYGEEDDFCQRMKQAGWKVFYLPTVRVVHHGRASVDQMADQMFLQLYRSKVAFFRKHRGPLQTFLLKCILYFGHWPRLALAGIGYTVSGWRRAARRARLKRCWRLLLELPRY